MTKDSQKKNEALKMIGEKHNFSLFSPTVKLTICRAHDQYVEKKIV